MTDTYKLEEAIKESGLKKSFIAEKLGLSRQGFLNKCNNSSAFTSVEINALCQILDITKLTEKEAIFFAK